MDIVVRSCATDKITIDRGSRDDDESVSSKSPKKTTFGVYTHMLILYIHIYKYIICIEVYTYTNIHTHIYTQDGELRIYELHTTVTRIRTNNTHYYGVVDRIE